MRALLVDSDSLDRDFLSFALARQGWNITNTNTIAEAAQQLAVAKSDLVVICTAREDPTNLEFCRRFRATYPSLALIIVGASQDDRTEVAFFQAGVDDYIARPFDPQVLVARCGACCRRVCGPAKNETSPKPLPQRTMSISPDGQVLIGGQRIVLSRTELRLLNALAIRGGRAVGRDDLLREFGSEDGERHSNQVNVYISRLRHKLERDPGHPRLILTLRGRGYALAVDESY